MSSAQVKISQLPAAGPITGTEAVPIVQNGQTVQTTTAAISATPSQFQTFLTLNSEATLPNSRYLSTGLGLGLSDGGALSYYRITLNRASGSLENALTGIIAKDTASSVIARTLQTSGNGLSVTDGNGVSGNPTFSLTGQVLSLANVTGPGLVALPNNGSVVPRILTGTASEIDVANGTGALGNPTIGIADDPILPGTGAVTLPKGTSAQKPGGVAGMVRYNTDAGTFEGYTLSGWNQFALTGGVTSFSAGTTGLTPSVATTGAVSLGGVLNSASGGTGVNNGSYTTTLGGNISTAGAFTTSGAFGVTLTATGLTNITLPASGTLATLAGSETLTNKTISGSANTLSNIGNSSLTNSSVTFNGVTVALGASGTITAAVPNALTVGTGLQLNLGTTFDGSAAKTLSLVTPVAATNGGTGISGYATGDLVYANAATTLARLAIGASSRILTSTGTAPSWTDPSTITIGAATNAVNVGITDDTSTNATMYPVWVTANTGNRPAKVTSTKLSFNPSTGVLTATGGISGGTF